MVLQTTNHVEIKGICSAVPSKSRYFFNEYTKMGQAFVEKNSQAIGVIKRHLAPSSMCASDLAFAAVENLIDALGWDKTAIDVLIFVTQTPDYIIPGTSSVLHNRLQLSKHTIVFDINLGCSGYIYGLWLVSSLLQNGCLKKGLLVVADTISKIIDSKSHELQLLFGDAASVTALEYQNQQESKEMNFNLGSDGSGFDSLIIPKGLFRKMNFNQDLSAQVKKNVEGKSNKLYIDGPEMMSFVLTEVPKMVQELMQYSGLEKSDIDYWVMHQANKLVITSLAKKMDISLRKTLFSLDEFGNTSSASIPLTISSRLSNVVKQKKTMMLIGFGVGFSWGAVLIRLGDIVMPEIIYLD